MALKPVDFKSKFSQGTSADNKSADVVVNKESNIGKQNIDIQKIGVRKLSNTFVTASTDGNVSRFSSDTIALPALPQRIVNLLHAFSIKPSPLAQQAVLLAIAEGLRLSPVLITRIIHVLEKEPHPDALTLIRALDEEDNDIFFKALAFLTKIRSSCEQADQQKHGNQGQQNAEHNDGQHDEGQTSAANHAMIAETEEKYVIQSQFKALFNECFSTIKHEKTHDECSSADASNIHGACVPNFTWIHIPFAFREGSLNLTGYLRMVYNYFTQQVERMVLECVDEQAERLAVLESGRALFWSSSDRECISAEQQGFTCVLQKEAVQVCALCGINAGIGADNEKKQ